MLLLQIVELATKIYSKDEVIKVIRDERTTFFASQGYADTPDSSIEADEKLYQLRDAEREKESQRIRTLNEEMKAEAGEDGTYEELKLPEYEERPIKMLFDRITTHEALVRQGS